MSYAAAQMNEAAPVSRIESGIRELEAKAEYFDVLAHRIQSTFRTVLTPEAPTPPPPAGLGQVLAVQPAVSESAERLELLARRLGNIAVHFENTISRAEL